MNTQLAHAESKPQSQHPKRLFPPRLHPSGSRKVMIVLAVCMGLQMTSFVMILPLFARRFSDFGAGVEALGASVMAYAITGTLAAPFMGALADRLGRRPLILGSLAAYVLAFSGYLFAASAPIFILLRGLAGAFTAGLFPAVTGSVADLAPTDRRAQWIGIVNGGASVGWIVGPLLGGVLYDRWGYGVACAASIIMAAVTFLAVFLTVPETLTTPGHQAAKIARNESHFRMGNLKTSLRTFRESLPSGCLYLSFY